MADEQNYENSNQYGIDDFNQRLRDIEEQNKTTKERSLIISQNLIDFKDEISEELKDIKKQNTQIQKDIEKLKSIANALVEESGKYIKREEIMLIERMLKDFQPLEFARMKDVMELINSKTKKTTKQKSKTKE